MENFVEEAMPQSLPVLEAVYGKLFFGSGRSCNQLFTNMKLNARGEVKTTANIINGALNNISHSSTYSPENVVWQIVKFFANHESENRSALSRSYKYDNSDGTVNLSPKSR